jgi:RNA-directed DNA polymerase
MLPTPSINLLDQVLSTDNLNSAWVRVRANKGASGIDGMTIDKFLAYFQAEGKGLVEEIRQGRYNPYPVKRVYIEKDGGGWRGLGIPTIFDRVIQQAIVQVITPIFDPTFSESCFGFRPNHSQHQAMEQVQGYVAEGRRTAVDVDLSKFFDRVNHDLLMTLLGKKIRDKGLQKLIAKYLRAGVVENGVLHECREGVPQGGPLSPLLSNVVLDLLDKELERRGHKFARWADDFIILVHSKRAGDRVLASVTRFVERKLKLKVNEQKSQVVPTSRSKFLGFSFRGKELVWHADSLAKFKRKVRKLTNRSQGKSMRVIIQKLTMFLRGWINYFGVAKGFQKCVTLDQWIRRRLRMCYWKQWRKTRTKVRNLLRLGVPLNLAVTSASSNKGYWRNSRTPGINRALSVKVLAERGLYSLRDRWVELHYG